VFALSSIVAVPLKENGQVGNPGKLTFPVTVTGTVVLLTSCPDAVPEMIRPPAQMAEKVPLRFVADWLLTLHWKFPQVEGFGARML
jgi:hypothetical protein